jgi:hypothetical protein
MAYRNYLHENSGNVCDILRGVAIDIDYIVELDAKNL